MRKVDSMTECGRADLSKFDQSMSLMFGARVRGVVRWFRGEVYRVWCRNITVLIVVTALRLWRDVVKVCLPERAFVCMLTDNAFFRIVLRKGIQ